MRIKMIVFKVRQEDSDNRIEFNFCESGVYVEIGDDMDMYNFILTPSEAVDLVEFLNKGLEGERVD